MLALRHQCFLLVRRPLCTSSTVSALNKHPKKKKETKLPKLLRRPENKTSESKAFDLSRSELAALASDDLEEIEIQKIDELLSQTGTNDVSYDWDQIMDVITNKLPVAPKMPLEAKEILMQGSITCNLAKVINDHPTLQRLVDLGVNLGRWERTGAADLALALNFERDVKPRLQVLHKYNVKPHYWGHMLTSCPGLLQEEPSNLEARFDYLLSRDFSASTAASMVAASPFWLRLSVTEIDGRLGFFQSHFNLSQAETRQLASICPRLITWVGVSMQVQLNCFALKDGLELSSNQLKNMLMRCPRIFMTRSTHSLNRMIDFLRDDVGYEVELILRFPEVFTKSWTSTFGRLKFLRFLKRDQFDPLKPCYISPLALIMPDDEAFCKEVAKTDLQTYYQFLKTI